MAKTKVITISNQKGGVGNKSWIVFSRMCEELCDEHGAAKQRDPRTKTILLVF